MTYCTSDSIGHTPCFEANRDRHFGSGNFQERLVSLLEEKYGREFVEESDDGAALTISVDGINAVIDLETLVSVSLLQFCMCFCLFLRMFADRNGLLLIGDFCLCQQFLSRSSKLIAISL